MEYGKSAYLKSEELSRRVSALEGVPSSAVLHFEGDFVVTGTASRFTLPYRSEGGRAAAFVKIACGAGALCIRQNGLAVFSAGCAEGGNCFTFAFGACEDGLLEFEFSGGHAGACGGLVWGAGMSARYPSSLGFACGQVFGYANGRAFRRLAAGGTETLDECSDFSACAVEGVLWTLTADGIGGLRLDSGLQVWRVVDDSVTSCAVSYDGTRVIMRYVRRGTLYERDFLNGTAGAERKLVCPEPPEEIDAVSGGRGEFIVRTVSGKIIYSGADGAMVYVCRGEHADAVFDGSRVNLYVRRGGTVFRHRLGESAAPVVAGYGDCVLEIAGTRYELRGGRIYAD